jgi:hypothetical protein
MESTSCSSTSMCGYFLATSRAHSRKRPTVWRKIVSAKFQPEEDCDGYHIATLSVTLPSVTDRTLDL